MILAHRDATDYTTDSQQVRTCTGNNKGASSSRGQGFRDELTLGIKEVDCANCALD